MDKLHTIISNKDESVPMFENKFLDFFSRVHFTIPILIFLPVILYFSYQSFFVVNLSWFSLLGLFLIGIFTWTVFEYATHRFIFHYHPTSDFGKKVHFIFHGIHHAYPNDSMRLVMVPAVSVPMAFIIYYCFHYLLGPVLMVPAFAGFAAAYLFYDLTHYAIHHLQFNNRIFKILQEHHLKHHYVDPDHGYGFTSKLWDKVFDTDFRKNGD